MAVRPCRVIFRDLQEIEHSVTVHAETVMEAAALGFKRICEQTFTEADFTDVITVELVTSTLHKVSLPKVTDWLKSAGRSPREASLKARVRASK